MATKRLLALLLGLALLISGCGGGSRKTAEAPKTESPAGYSPTTPTQDAAVAPPSLGSTSSRGQSVAESKAEGSPPRSGSNGSQQSPPVWNQQELPAKAPADMYFQDYGENPLINTSRRPTSTFSVDVDTASFTLARNYLSRSTLPPPESVRVEEFINYFPQGYPRPTEDLAVHIEGAPHPFHPDTYLIEIGLQARQVKASQRKPALLTFVVDVSGSMDMENRLGLVKRSLHLLLDQLEGDDRVALVTYASEAQVVLEPTADKEKNRRAIDQLQPGGSTYAEEGLQMGYQLASRHFLQSGINRIILCSDGVANVGKTGPEEILRQVEDYKAKGITLTTVGFGMGNYNDVLMERLADKGDGQYAYVDELGEARRIFVEQLSGTLQVVARDTKIQVSFDPEQVAAYRLVGYENRVMANQEFRNDAADAGEVGSGQSVTALYEVQLTGRSSVLGSVSIRYKLPDNPEKVIEKSFDIRRSAVFSTPSSHLLWTASVAEFAGILARSPWATESSLETVRSSARRAAADLGQPESHQSLLEMIEQARALGIRR